MLQSYRAKELRERRARGLTAGVTAWHASEAERARKDRCGCLPAEGRETGSTPLQP